MTSGMVFHIEKVKFTVSVIQHRKSEAVEDSADSESLFYLPPL